jgi:nicotinate-nucleotide--dimethylbenzimidazole phosphoribosyltransferase
MIHFAIKPLDRSLESALVHKINSLTKPKGSLGFLEELALQIGLIQHTLSPVFTNPTNVLFGGDHGVIYEGVSLSPKQVTYQQMAHFATGTAGVNFLCRQHGFNLVLVDAGVDAEFDPKLGILDRKVRRSTRNYLHEDAMTAEELEMAVERGAEVVRAIHADGCNVVSFGEMGSGNTSSSSIWMHVFGNIPLAECVGAGAGLDSAGIRHKLDVLTRALRRHDINELRANPLMTMAAYGGFEMVMAVGAMLQAAELKMTILLDGFIMSACLLAASQLYPEVKEYVVYGHVGDESGHKRMIEILGGRPVLNLGLRLGEGTGAICAYPIVASALHMINEMDTFVTGKVTKYFK